MGYTSSAIKGISWMSGFRLFTRVISFLKTLVIARVLSPSQFGLFGVASLALSFLEMITETGINVVIVQSKKDIKEYINSAWVISIGRGLLISLLIFISSALVANFFNLQDFKIIQLISIVPLIRGFINPAIISFQKELKFKNEFLFRSSIFTFDAVISITTAILTGSVYSLVWGMIGGALLEVLLSFKLVSLRPSFSYEKEYIRDIFHKGKWVTLYGIFNYFAQEGDNIVVGRLLGAGALGIYQMAYKLSILPISEVTDVVSKVVFPVYAKIEDDKKRLKRAFVKSTFFITLGTISIGSIIFFFPQQVVLILLGDKWLGAVPVLKILAWYGVLRAISGSASTIFLASSKQSYVTKMTFARFITLFVTIYPFVNHFGMIGAGYSALLSVLIEIPVIIFFIIKIFGSKK